MKNIFIVFNSQVFAWLAKILIIINNFAVISEQVPPRWRHRLSNHQGWVHVRFLTFAASGWGFQLQLGSLWGQLSTDSKLHEATRRCTRLHTATQGYTRLHEATRSYTRLHTATGSFTRQHTATRRCTRLHVATQGYTQLHTSSASLQVLCEWSSQYSQNPANTQSWYIFRALVMSPELTTNNSSRIRTKLRKYARHFCVTWYTMNFLPAHLRKEKFANWPSDDAKLRSSQLHQ